jgi:nitrile hydratase
VSHDHDHPHPKQPDIEETALGYHEALAEAVIGLLRDKAVFTADEFRKVLETAETRKPANGARLVARTWVDPAFRELALRDVNAAAAQLGLDAGTIPIRAVENTRDTHNVIVCTLCSCYPVMLLGSSPDWYKSREYRSRVVREPRAVLREFGLELADDIGVVVHDSTAELRYMVLPRRPGGTDGWTEDRLASIVTRDCMIGVAVPNVSGAA